MPEESHLRQLNLKRPNGFARRGEPLCQLVELVMRSEGIQQGHVRHPALKVAIMNLANRLDGWLHLAGRDQHDGSGKRFSVHTTPHKLEWARRPHGLWTLLRLAMMPPIMYDEAAEDQETIG
jgi:hypothetical protein